VYVTRLLGLATGMFNVIISYEVMCTRSVFPHRSAKPRDHPNRTKVFFSTLKFGFLEHGEMGKADNRSDDNLMIHIGNFP
jgi:hypothetical protein